ncbi:helix-turn-helix domain-containing protein [Pseudomonas sp. Sample_14]|jgi:GTP-sensing pleiotropic transcriptional regulator CodY|uniref:MarR family transcriptional regulator n=1 Tax=Pseudomonas sp. Sample_14 TaxID=2448262 RepID=UPI001032C8A9|nr:helix-turn-helix domain-containing protein [Pseudomonas sp. Sample_14]
MTKRIVALPADTDEIGESYFYNPSLFEELSKLNRTNPQAVSVMLNLVAGIDDDGAVQITQAAIARQCEITLQEVVKAIADLEAAGLIRSVQTGSEPGGSLACLVNPNLARAEKPDELGSLSVAG